MGSALVKPPGDNRPRPVKPRPPSSTKGHTLPSPAHPGAIGAAAGAARPRRHLGGRGSAAIFVPGRAGGGGGRSAGPPPVFPPRCGRCRGRGMPSGPPLPAGLGAVAWAERGLALSKDGGGGTRALTRRRRLLAPPLPRERRRVPVTRNERDGRSGGDRVGAGPGGGAGPRGRPEGREGVGGEPGG